ncbi:hypothetical protein ABZW30_05970 [Kitasatospora sp. NPDC004669]
MKSGIHPDYRPVVFRDKVGRSRVPDTAGRVERFHRRYGNRH